MNARPQSRRGGFTLIEMLITLVVFLLLAGAIFSIFGATLQGATTLRDDQSRADEDEALGAWLRQSFLSLPADAALVSYHREGRPFNVSGIIWDAAGQLRALDLQPQANGHYLLRYCGTSASELGLVLGGVTGTAGYSPDLVRFQTLVYHYDASLRWRVLVRDLKSADWRFRTANSTVWTDTFTGGKPLLTELTFQPAGLSDPVVDDFWIPPLQPPSLGIAAPPVAVPVQ